MVLGIMIVLEIHKAAEETDHNSRGSKLAACPGVCCVYFSVLTYVS